MLLLGLLVAGCTRTLDGEFPSLARRPIEALDPAAEPVRTATPAPATDPVASAEAQAALAAATAGDTAFRGVLAREAPAVRQGAGTPPGSERWAAAQLALSRLQAAREPTVDARVQADAAGDADVRQRVAAIDDAQDREVRALIRLLPEP